MVHEHPVGYITSTSDYSAGEPLYIVYGPPFSVQPSNSGQLSVKQIKIT